MAGRRPEIVSHAVELFAPLGSIRARPMFGGYGFYCDDVFFALVAHETLYLKADGATRGLFRDAGCEPFRYVGKDGRPIEMGYWSAPEEALDSAGAMAPWARRAIACALAARRPPKKA